MAPYDATDVNIGFKQFVIAVDSYAARNHSTTDVSIMCSNLCDVN